MKKKTNFDISEMDVMVLLAFVSQYSGSLVAGLVFCLHLMLAKTNTFKPLLTLNIGKRRKELVRSLLQSFIRNRCLCVNKAFGLQSLQRFNGSNRMYGLHLLYSESFLEEKEWSDVTLCLCEPSFLSQTEWYFFKNRLSNIDQRPKRTNLASFYLDCCEEFLPAFGRIFVFG